MFLAIAFLLLGFAGSGIGGTTGPGSQNARLFGLTRRAVTAATAGALALAGAVTGVVCGYLAAFGFFGNNKLDGLSELSSIPVANLLLIVVGMPLAAVVVGWLLACREPPAIGRQPME